MRRLRGNEMGDFQKEALRLVKELAEDEAALKKAKKLVYEYECEGNIAKATGEAEYLEDCMDRKMRVIETIIHC